MPFVDPTSAPHTRLSAFGRLPLVASESVRLVLIEMPAKFRTISHRHPGATESFFILTGSGTFTIGGSGPIAVAPGDLLYAVLDEVDTLEAGDAGLRFVACVGPNEDRPDEEVQVVGVGEGPR